MDDYSIYKSEPTAVEQTLMHCAKLMLAISVTAVYHRGECRTPDELVMGTLNHWLQSAAKES